ncbi:hypothetical protein JM47_01395 [Ureaplasma diversum]|uniref:MFS transporter n=1 Tax=Ureaplasma diversum TaxID=42094 RepID=A0A0C5S1L4_9BACT|nr:hypothetical protein [Ureaplasma diversum]AJQ45270.1 hypothetical protein JM47_01395 [Ureaplasma diversum]
MIDFLTFNQKVSVAVNSSIFLLILIASIIFLMKVKFEEKGYKLAYIFYIIFWIPTALVRNLNAPMQNALGDVNLLWLVLGAYGFVGIFIRAFADYMHYLIRYRKAFLLLSIIVMTITYIPILIQPNTTTNIIQTIGVGIGASCIGTYQLLFKEQYLKQKYFLAVSLLSIPPLLANFLTSPIRSMMNALALRESTTKQLDPEILKYTWIIGIVFLIVAFVMWFFIKEKRHIAWNLTPLNQTKNETYQIISFILYALAGLLILFIRFSNSGSVASLHIQILNKYIDQKAYFYESYLTIVHNLFQLCAGVLMGTVLIKRLSTWQIMMIGCAFFMIYHTAAIFAVTPISFITIHALNGFAYGLVYNVILTIVVIINLRTNKVSAMGIYQSVLAIGITLSGPFVNFVKVGFSLYNKNSTLAAQEYYRHNQTYNLILLGGVIVAAILITAAYWINKKGDQNKNNKLITSNLLIDNKYRFDWQKPIKTDQFSKINY